ncbi:hypothetical protein BAUCODRAFT_532353 [Baudoinia panamericana UAMH 10762]|uniref:Uncharacterized protein n=1 Tax=Baudoinia panamericana (strain UAMH 10762) TaxID=717646 RepID=M2LLQ4_BAUPA|nr:uncharacterized protein BAUCODRAFT_532353 [Baudoinia panamericana UAMH 10762]EMC95232.1 hypothetical protein BAUCODRAFT_532353 [Baudoinia panamericana UAMH 10762]
MTLATNGSQGDRYSELIWAPNRQVLYQFSGDQLNLMQVADNYNYSTLKGIDASYGYTATQALVNSYVPLNKSLQASVQRIGPIFGAAPKYWWITNGNTRSWTISISSEKTIKCFSSYINSDFQFIFGDNPGANNFTKCIRYGSGWGSATNKISTFTIDGVAGSSNPALRAPIKVSVIASDRATLLGNGSMATTGSRPALSSDCLFSNKTSLITSEAACNWTYFFSDAYNQWSTTNATQLVNTVLWEQNVGGSVMTRATDFVMYMAFTLYTFDPAPSTNPLRLVNTPALGLPGQRGFTSPSPIPVDPAWTLATWSVDEKGHLPANRTTTLTLLNLFDSWWNGNTGDLTAFNYNGAYAAMSWMPILQQLSMIDYEVTYTAPAGQTAKTAPMYRNARIYVWSYGMGSRTSYLGGTVAVIGIVVVLAQSAMAFVWRKETRSLTALLIAALAHSPQNEFAGKEQDEVQCARVRFRLMQQEHLPGGIAFDATSQ